MKVIKITSLACTSCIIMNQKFNEYKKDKNIEVIELDYDLNSDEVQKYNIGNILPVFIIYKDNEEKLRIIGEKNKKEFFDLLDTVEGEL